MPGRNSREALQRFVEPLQRAVSCLTSSILLHTGASVSDTPHFLRLSDDPSMIGQDRRFTLQLRLRYYMVRTEGDREPWQVQTSEYAYTLSWGREPGENILAYHWHPDGRSPITFPHLHLYAGAQLGLQSLQNAHIPTGRVGTEAVIRFLIEELDVIPLRPDWRQILD
jgi:hypothetical protein